METSYSDTSVHTNPRTCIQNANCDRIARQAWPAAQRCIYMISIYFSVKTGFKTKVGSKIAVFLGASGQKT
jgi:hypothetical protein